MKFLFFKKASIMSIKKYFTNCNSGEKYILPIVPIRDIVIFPNTTVPVFIGKKKTINALNHALANNSDVFVMSQTDNVFGVDVVVINLKSIGTICKIAQIMKLPDGTMKVVFDCICRAKLETSNSDNDYLSGEITPIVPEQLQDEIKNASLVTEIKELLKKFKDISSKIPIDIYQNIMAINEPEIFADVLMSRIEISLKYKMEILQITNLEKRLERIIEILVHENGINEIQTEIRRRTDKNIEKNNREYYLQEQMRVIRRELGDNDNPFDLSDKYERKIEEKRLPKKVTERVREEIKRLKYLSPMSSEAGVVRGYLDTIFDLPWHEKSELKKDINFAEQYLNNSHYGMEKAKERILESVAVQIKTGEQPKRTILCLYGAPGVGKTSLAEAMAKSIGREFVRISLGGVCDEAEIRGHRKTYLGSMPGKIIMAMKQAKTVNPLILLDEIDKISSDSRGDPASALLEVLDYQQNNKFSDHYLEVEYDLSQVMFVTTANSLKINYALLDRLEVIKIPSYLEHEKFKIAKNYILDRQLKENGLSNEEFFIDDDTILDVIKYYTREAGVRDLERKISKICRKSVIKILQTNEPVYVNRYNLKEFLGVKKYEHTIIERRDFVGVANGLAYTEVGGDILMIEAVKYPNGKGDIKFTGELGDVMKESIQTAFSLIKSKAENFGINPSIFEKYDIHVHVPDGATPKDGPSAGITIVSAIVSLLTNIPVSKYLAMTGEISLRGAVLPIGGLREKLTSAVRSGVREVIIPKDNEKDLEELPQDIISKLIIHPCDRIESVMDIVFGERNKCKNLFDDNNYTVDTINSINNF